VDILGRTNMTIGCADCDAIPKVADAGRTIATPDATYQLMHNGVKVISGGYHGAWMAQIIRALRGHHEPQEELLFHHLLRHARHDTLMVELGCFWSYYSLWYLAEIPGARTLGVEPDSHNLAIGQKNAALNGMAERMDFIHAGVGGAALEHAEIRGESTQTVEHVPVLDMDALLARCDGQPIELLHMDTQGQELPFITSMDDAIATNAVRFLVVSTHHGSISGSPTTHEDCLAALKDRGAIILAEHSVQESFSGDGLIVASFAADDRLIRLPEMSRNTPENALFPDA